MKPKPSADKKVKPTSEELTLVYTFVAFTIVLGVTLGLFLRAQSVSPPTPVAPANEQIKYELQPANNTDISKVDSEIEDNRVGEFVRHLIETGDIARCSGGNIKDAERCYQQAATNCKEIKGSSKLSLNEQILLRQGIVFYMENNFGKARNLFAECVALAKDLDDEIEVLTAKSWCARAQGMAGDHINAALEFKHLAERYTQIEGPIGKDVGISLFYQGEQLLLAADRKQASVVLNQALSVYESNGATQGQIQEAKQRLAECRFKR